MVKYLLLASTALTLAACEISENPADGGFLSGVVGVAGGGYQGRIDDREAALAAEQAQANALAAEQAQVAATNASISAELARLRQEHTALRLKIADQLAALQSAGVNVPTSMETRVRAVVNTTPSGRTDAQRLAALRTAIADARALSADLSRLS